jgi:hypothetical protein
MAPGRVQVREGLQPGLQRSDARQRRLRQFERAGAPFAQGRGQGLQARSGGGVMVQGHVGTVRASLAMAPVPARHRGQQRLGVGMRRVGVDLGQGPAFDDTALVHHDDAVADLARHAQVMGDEQHRQPEPVADVGQQAQHLVLHRHIQRRHRLVGDQDGRLERERARQADALALAARELVRITRRGAPLQPHQIEQLQRARRAEAALTPCTMGPSAISCPTVRRGLSEPNGSWNTICMRRRTGRSARALSAAMSAPSTMIWPLSASISRAMQRAAVDLPEPDSPTMPTVSPRRTLKLTPPGHPRCGPVPPKSHRPLR